MLQYELGDGKRSQKAVEHRYDSTSKVYTKNQQNLRSYVNSYTDP